MRRSAIVHKPVICSCDGPGSSDVEDIDKTIGTYLSKHRMRHPKSAVERVTLPTPLDGMDILQYAQCNPYGDRNNSFCIRNSQYDLVVSVTFGRYCKSKHDIVQIAATQPPEVHEEKRKIYEPTIQYLSAKYNIEKISYRSLLRSERTDRLDTATCTQTLLSTDVHIRTDHVRYTLRYLHCFSVDSCPHPSDSALNGILAVKIKFHLQYLPYWIYKIIHCSRAIVRQNFKTPIVIATSTYAKQMIRNCFLFGRLLYMLGKNPQKIRGNAEILVEASKAIELEVNPEKTKYMIMSPDQNIVRNGTIKIEDLSFEEVEKFEQE
ncbi:hypothetical protein ANN_19011 [Periplaneta americana]|uniref:Uncharacterized protein n=1 Tax=Periplaneta americana TaxID=6978 RepID=A0ABQ8SQA9_PERAM|nr:hypothetical protein ANN_19011 [Periplaneta americana]